MEDKLEKLREEEKIKDLYERFTGQLPNFCCLSDFSAIYSFLKPILIGEGMVKATSKETKESS